MICLAGRHFMMQPLRGRHTPSHHHIVCAASIPLRASTAGDGRVQSKHIRKIILKMRPTDSISGTRTLLHNITRQILFQLIANTLRIYFDVDPL